MKGSVLSLLLKWRTYSLQSAEEKGPAWRRGICSIRLPVTQTSRRLRHIKSRCIPRGRRWRTPFSEPPTKQPISSPTNLQWKTTFSAGQMLKMYSHHLQIQATRSQALRQVIYSKILPTWIPSTAPCPNKMTISKDSQVALRIFFSLFPQRLKAGIYSKRPEAVRLLRCLTLHRHPSWFHRTQPWTRLGPRQVSWRNISPSLLQPSDPTLSSRHLREPRKAFFSRLPSPEPGICACRQANHHLWWRTYVSWVA